MRKIILLILAATLFASCGKKGGISYPPDGQKKPKFNRVFDDETR